MSSDIGLAVVIPSTAIGYLNTCYGVEAGGSVTQVINLTSGADLTASFDPYLPAIDTIVQVDTTPSHTNAHLVVFKRPGYLGEPSVKFCLVHSLGATSGTQGSVTAVGLMPGDTIFHAIQPVLHVGLGQADVTNKFAPTCAVSGTIYQLDGISTYDSVLLMLRPDGASSPTVGIASIQSGFGTLQGVQNIIARSRIIAALDLTTPANAISGMDPYSPADGFVVGTYNPTGIVLILYELP